MENRGKMIRNFYNESITKDEQSDLVKRIMALPDKMIDELWFRIGYIESAHGTNKALSPENIKRIKGSEKAAQSFFVSVFEETHIYRIKTFLDEVELECGIQRPKEPIETD